MAALQLDRIEELMAAYGMGPVELAESAGLSYNFVYRLRKGERSDVSASNLAAIARVLGTSADYLLGMTDIPTSSEKPALGEARQVYSVGSSDEYRDLQRLVTLVNRMTPEQRAAFLSFAETVTGGGSETAGGGMDD